MVESPTAARNQDPVPDARPDAGIALDHGHIAAELAKSAHPRTVLRQALAAACRLLGASWGRIWLFDDRGDNQDVGAFWPPRAPGTSSPSRPPPGSAEQSVLVPLLRRRKQAIAAEDALGQSLFPYLRKVAQESGCAGLQARPLEVRGQVLGALVVGFRNPQSLTPSGNRILDDLAEAVAIGLLAARNLAGSRVADSDLALGANRPTVQLQYPFHRGMLEDSLGEMCRVFCADGAAIWRWDELGGRFEIEASHAAGDPVVVARAFEEIVHGSIGADVFQNRRDLTLAVRTPGAGHMPTRLRLKSLGFQVVEAAPLMFQGSVLGGLCLVFRGPPPSSPRASGLLRLVAQQMAAALAVWRSTALLAAENDRRKVAEQDLRTANEALKAQAAQLLRQRDEVENARRLERQHIERLRELDQLKTNFLNAASHELRTPLSSIKGYSEFLADELVGDLNPDQHGFVREIQDGADRLTRLVDDMLDFARLEAGTFQVALQESDIRGVVAAAVGCLVPQARQAGIRISRSVPSDPVRLPMDPKRIEQVLLNLIGNAIKFTPRGGRIVIRVRPGKDAVRVEVRDTGIGISQDHLDRIFEKFFQADPSTTREHGGAGLGLAISRAIVFAHEGRMSVRSAMGKGSVFEFELPYRPEIALAAQAQAI